MGRIFIAGLIGAVIYFIWGMLTWMVIPLHGPTIQALPAERAIVDALVAQNLESGVYVAPYAADMAEMEDPESEYMKKHLAGPIFSVYYQKEGGPPMSGGVMAKGFGMDLLAALLAACLLSCLGPCGNSYWCRVGFVTGLGVFAAIVTHLAYWNWMHFPLGYTLAFVIDVVVGWALAGLAMALIVRPCCGVSKTSTTELEGNSSKSALTPTQKNLAPVPAAPQRVKPLVPEAPIRNDAITLLATLQREARLVDIVKEPLADYTDAQVGAAARDVLRDCGTVLDRLFQLAPIVDQEEGTSVEVPSGPAAARYRVTGSTGGNATSGALVHHGWEAKQVELPKWTGAKEAALVISPAELEVK